MLKSFFLWIFKKCNLNFDLKTEKRDLVDVLDKIGASRVNSILSPKDPLLLEYLKIAHEMTSLSGTVKERSFLYINSFLESLNMRNKSNQLRLIEKAVIDLNQIKTNLTQGKV